MSLVSSETSRSLSSVYQDAVNKINFPKLYNRICLLSYYVLPNAKMLLEFSSQNCWCISFGESIHQCHYFLIQLSPFASTLEPDQYQWQKRHSDFICSLLKMSEPWEKKNRLELLNNSTNLSFSACQSHGEGGAIQKLLCNTASNYDFFFFPDIRILIRKAQFRFNGLHTIKHVTQYFTFGGGRGGDLTWSSLT